LRFFKLKKQLFTTPFYSPDTNRSYYSRCRWYRVSEVGHTASFCKLRRFLRIQYPHDLWCFSHVLLNINLLHNHISLIIIRAIYSVDSIVHSNHNQVTNSCS